MNIVLTSLAIVIVAMALLLVGCTSNRPYRTNFDATGGDPARAVIETTDDYKLGFVEFDDQGWFWDARQRCMVEQMIRNEAGIGSTPGETPQPILLVAFVHGWKDNASYDNDGVVAFRQILQELKKAERVRTDYPPRKVVGVYLGWRGLSATLEPFKELSFWERKETAHKVGGYGAMTKLLADLENIQSASLDSLPKKSPRTELIIIGHSFGGAAVYSALSQIITQQFVDTVEKGKRLKPLGDQVILLNPAFEAQRHFDLNQLALAIKHYPEDQRPVLSIFTSKGDWATHYAFPVGQFFSTFFESNRDSEQRTAGLETVGWFCQFVTHELDFKATASSPATQAGDQRLGGQTPDIESENELRRSINNVEIQRGKWHPNGPAPQTYTFDQTILRPVDDFHPGDPFLIVSVDPQIIRDHSDISNPVLIHFLREYIQFCRVDPKDHTK